MLIGTAAYLPPEQLQGHKLDARSDLYSLGAMLYEMVTGRPPFVGDGLVSLIGQHLNAQPVAPSVHNPLIPPVLDALILQLLEKNPDRRPESATVVRSLLHAIATASLSAAEHPSPSSSHALDRLASEVFVGREQEMDTLREQLEATFAGHGRVAILTGEPGIGKTRTAMEFATYARLRGARVLIGRCHDEEGMPPYWLWVHLMRTYIAERSLATLRTELGSGAAAIAHVITEVRNRFPDLPTPPSQDPTHARFHFFDSFTQFVKTVAKNQPFVLILDDLQWADTPSLLLLQFLVREIADAPLLVVVTCRDIPRVSPSPLTETLAALTRAPSSQTLLLQGLSKSEVARFIEITTATMPGEELTAAVYHGTEGHPFFLTEVIRLLATEGNPSLLPNNGPMAFDLPLPQGVRSAIEGRLTQVSEACRQLLTTAAVIGREFDFKVLEGLLPSSSPALLNLLDEAIAARLIASVASLAGRYGFSHALVRETLYESLSLGRCLHLHQQIGEVLEQRYSDVVEEHLAELAHHFLIAAQCGGNVTKAVGYARRAGDHALKLLAYEEASTQYERALQALALQPPQEQIRGELLLALGEAQRRAGNIPTAQEHFLAAAATARQQRARDKQRAAVLLARAALGYGATLFLPTNRDPVLRGLCEEALDLLGDAEPILRARITAQFAIWWYPGDPERARALSEQTVQLALQINDPRTLAVAFWVRRYVIAFPENLEERLTLSTAMVTLGQQRGYREVEALGHQWRTADVLEQGDRSEVDHEIAAHAQFTEELQQPQLRWHNLVFQAMNALRQGQLIEGERLVHEALNSGLRVQSQSPFIFFNAQLYQLRTFQGRFQDLEETVKHLIQQYPHFIIWQCALAYLYCELNRREEASRIFAPLAADDFASLPRDLNWSISVALLSETCCFLGNTRAAGLLYDQLLPLAKQHIVVGQAVASYGSASYYLGLLATTLERWREAEAHFTHALAANVQMAVWPWVAYTETAYARMLLTRNHSGDQEKATALLDRALATTQELGLVGLEEKIQG